MEFENVIYGKNIIKKYPNFELNVPELRIPKGFATAFIGENGAGKTTLIDILAGINLTYKGELTYFGKYNDKDRENDPSVKNRIGYTGTGNYFLPQWTLKQIKEVQQLLFDSFDPDKYDDICDKLAITKKDNIDAKKNVNNLSDGNKTKLMLAGVLARETDMLLLDEPASPLDPLMRDKLCEMIRDYMYEREGERSVLFSTHNIADMEAVTDYAIIVEHGNIVEQGFVEELKEKYIVVNGELSDYDAASKVLYSISKNQFGFTGIALTSDMDKLAGVNVKYETPTLTQIVVAIMKQNTSLA